jgi:hypothetical protein
MAYRSTGILWTVEKRVLVILLTLSSPFPVVMRGRLKSNISAVTGEHATCCVETPHSSS